MNTNDTPAQKLIEIAKRLKTMSHLGLTYTQNEYDVERYRDLHNMSLELMQLASGSPIEQLEMYFNSSKEYITPKVDIRAVIFNDKNEILLVKEKADGRWSVPGGWADIGLTPAEIAIKEAFEETGLQVEPVKLLAVLDKRCYPHPPEPDYCYKIFIQCKIVGGEFNQAFDILDRGFFTPNALPPLSLPRVLPEQMNLLFDFLNNPDKPAVFN